MDPAPPGAIIDGGRFGSKAETRPSALTVRLQLWAKAFSVSGFISMEKPGSLGGM